MSDTSGTTFTGYTCPSCGGWVSMGELHTCHPARATEYYHPPAPDYSQALGRIADALERIASQEPGQRWAKGAEVVLGKLAAWLEEQQRAPAWVIPYVPLEQALPDWYYVPLTTTWRPDWYVPPTTTWRPDWPTIITCATNVVEGGVW